MRKNGAPMMEVMMPTGSVIGERMVRPMVSHISKNTAPTNAEPIMRNSSLLPMHFRTICGTTNPMNAITPKKETATEVQIVVRTNPTIRVLSGLTPMLLAYSSPALTA